MNFVEELRWRGMLHDMMPGTEELLAKEQVHTLVSTLLRTLCTSGTFAV